MAASIASVPPPRVVGKWWVTAAVGVGALMSTIDTSIVNVALPHIRGSVGATLSEITWVSIGYIIAMVVIMPMTGFLGALWGQKRVYMASLVLFIVGSALCGLARSLPTLVLFRVLQGLGAGSLQPTQQAILRQTFPPEEQGMAMAMFAMVVMIGPAVGPVLGGWITDNYDWPWIFYINLPIGILGLSMVWQLVHEPEDIRRANKLRAVAQRGSFDWQGIVWMVLAVSSLQYVLEEGQSEGWFESPLILGCTALSAVSAIAFVIRELSATAPVVNLRLFRDKTFAAGTLIGGVMFGILMASMFLLPVFMQELLGYDATTSGLVLLPRTLVMMVFTPIVGRLYNRIPPAFTIAFGVLLVVFGSYELSKITLESSATDMIIPLGVTGAGFACLFVPLTTAALTFIQRSQLADASGLNTFVRQIGGSIGLTVFASMLSGFAADARGGLVPHVSLLRPEIAERAELMMERMGDPQAVIGALQGHVMRESAVLAFEKAFVLQGVCFLAVLPVLFFLRVDPRRAPKSR